MARTNKFNIYIWYLTWWNLSRIEKCTVNNGCECEWLEWIEGRRLNFCSIFMSCHRRRFTMCERRATKNGKFTTNKRLKLHRFSLSFFYFLNSFIPVPSGVCALVCMSHQWLLHPISILQFSHSTNAMSVRLVHYVIQHRSAQVLVHHDYGYICRHDKRWDEGASSGGKKRIAQKEKKKNKKNKN